MTRVAIIGGGISGLSAAYALHKRRAGGADIDYVLYEASPRFGGVLQSELVQKCLIEAGPDSFLTEKSWAADLCREIGLEDQLITSNDSQRKTYIVQAGRLVPIPNGLMFMTPTRILPVLFSPLFSWSAKKRMAREWFAAPDSLVTTDESVATFVERHYGEEMIERLVAPLLAGIYGGDASQLSVQAVLPRFVEMEKKYGSLSKGMLSERRAATAHNPLRPLFTSLKGGMQQLADALAKRLKPEFLRPNTSVQALQPQGDKWLVSAGYDSDQVDAVIIATPAYVAAKLLHIADLTLAAELTAIPYNSSITVAMAFDKAVRAALPPGFGFLVPQSEPFNILAATFVHNKFSFRAPADTALIRCFIGSDKADNYMQLGDERIFEIVRHDLQRALGIAAEPLFGLLYRWSHSMAQYTVGHRDRLARIRDLLQRLPGLALAGNAYSGIGIPDCIRSGMTAAAEVIDRKN
jgi:protoporphyrinogen/coproporphyrinogen III oxidase